MTYVGVFAIFCFILLGFWVMGFMISFIPVMATMLFLERFSPELGEKVAKALGNDHL